MKARPEHREPGATGPERLRESGSLVLFPGALGDAVCLEPALAHLAGYGPVTLYARGGAAEVAALFPSRPLVRSLDGVEVARLFSPQDDPRTDAWLSGFARIVSFTGAHVPAVVRRLLATGRATVAAFPRPPLALHAADYFLRIVTDDGAAAAPAPRLVCPDGAARGSSAAARLVLLPGSGGRAKRVATDVLASLAARWRRSSGEASIALGPAEEGEEAIWQPVGRVVHPSSIASLAATLCGATAFLGNDAGPSHVAAALGLPGVVFYAVTEPAAFGPRGHEVIAVRVTPGVDPGGAIDEAWAALARHLP